jgi:hypothetical protein
MRRLALTLSAVITAGLLWLTAASPSLAASTAGDTIFGNSVPTVVDSGDSNAVEVGVKFTTSQAGTITGVRFYKSASNTGTHVGSLWSSSGTLLAQATFANETGSGWQTVTFANPVSVTSGTTYVAGYLAPKGHYSATTGGLTSSVTSGPLTAVGNKVSADGVYHYGTTNTFPTSTYEATNYWVDVTFVPAGGTTTTGTTTTGTTTTPTTTTGTTTTGTGTPPPAGTDTVFATSTPSEVDSGDTGGVELGMAFQSSQAGRITGIRFYKAAANTGTHVGSLWSSTGTLLAQATFANETGSGWQNVTFSSPVSIAAGTKYIAGYFAPNGHYSDTVGGLQSSVVNGPLTALGNTTTPNGLYAYTNASGFPNSAWNASNYYVDVDFIPTSGGTGTTSGGTGTTSGGTGTTTTGTTTTGTTPPPTPPAAPSNTGSPIVSGTPQVGQQMSVSNGSWSGSPTSYRYQWQDCKSGQCTNVSGATASTYTPVSGDVGDNLDAVVTATNQGGSASAASTQSALVAAASAPSGGSGTSGTDCFADPGGCGYPDPVAAHDGGTANVGSTTPCASLPVHSGDFTASTNGATVSNMDITGSLNVNADNVTINNVCVTPAGGSWAIYVENGSNNTTIENTSIYSVTSTGLGYGVFNPSTADNVTAEKVYIHNASEGWEGSTGPTGSVNDSYFQSGGCSLGNTGGICGSGDHNEDVYIDDSIWSGNHDTMLNSQGQTAIFFGDDSGSAGGNQWTVKNSLLAGGGFAAYWDAKASSAGTEKLDIENNRWARCTTNAHSAGDGTDCGSFDGSLDGASTADQFGYFPHIGYYGGPIDGYCNSNGAVWTGNVYDDNNQTLSCD